jgi:hypothetical protein
MKGPARLFLASAVLISAASTSWGQVNIQPTPAPLVTAENETWYRTGEPIAFAGNLYYRAGAAIHFLPNEMVRSGSYRGVPFYSRTTIEPFSVIFVPAGGGLMQPYERRRDMDLAGTQGSTAPAISPALAPSVSQTTAASPFGAPSPAMAQAPAPPVIGAPVIADEPVKPVESNSAASAQPTASVPSPVGTAGRVATSVPRRPARIRPGSPNAIYVEFDNARWFSAGTPVSLDVRSLARVGESHGFPVYAVRPGDSTIYIPIAQGVDTYARYSKRR